MAIHLLYEDDENEKKLTYIVATALFAGVLITGCGKDVANTTEVTEQAEQTEDKSDKADYKNYESADGWNVKYNCNLIEVNESSEMVSFVYSGESAGTNMVEVSYIKDKQPKDAFMALINEKGASEVFVSSVSGLTSKDIFANGQGIAIGNGDVWFVDDGFTGLDQIGDPDFKIITLNGIIAE